MKPLERWWSAFPMVRIWVAMSIGILCYNGKQDHLALFVMTISFCVSTLFAWHKFQPTAKLKSLSAFAPMVLMASLGYLLMMTNDIRKNKEWFGHQHQKRGLILAEIVTEPSPGKENVRCIAEFRANRRHGIWYPISGRLWAQLPAGKYARGQYILTDAAPQFITLQLAGKNRFYSHLIRKQVLFLLKVSDTQVRMIPTAERRPLSLMGQQYLGKVLATYMTDEASKNMAGAILYGERSSLPRYLTQAYTQTGVIHVIAISGMHLAIIYSLVSFILKPLQKNSLKWLYCFLCVAFLWMYTWICGGTPSVQRSAWMFSFLLVGETLARYNSAGNSLAASAVVMLCIDPLLLWDIGFQLSYAAVASLLIYQKSIFRLLNPENLLLLYGWNLVSTTIAAQILTTPLVVFHFGQFPTVFLLSNILAVPLSGLILLLLCGAALAYPVGLGAPLALLAETLIQFMNTRIQALSQLRFASISDIHLGLGDMINIYLILLALTLWIRSKKR